MVLQIYFITHIIIFGLNNLGINFYQYSLIPPTAILISNKVKGEIPRCGKDDPKIKITTYVISAIEMVQYFHLGLQ